MNTQASCAVDIFHFGDFAFNERDRQLSTHGQNIKITTYDFMLLKALITHPHVALDRQQLVTLARCPNFYKTPHAIDVQILKLRRMIEKNPAQPTYIRTVRGVGYVFVPDGDAA